MADIYKLEWTHSRTTIQSGIGDILNKDVFLDTIVVCSDGAMSHNKLTLGLIFPYLNSISIFHSPVDQTLIMPDYTLEDIQTLIRDFFPNCDVKNSYQTKGDEIEINMDDSFSMEGDDFSIAPTMYGIRRGRGRPPLATSTRLPPRFQCDFCNKGFYYKSMLTAHEKLHTGGTRETCTMCDAEYSTRQNLKNHMIKHHGADSFTPRKRGRPPLDPEKRLMGMSPMRSMRSRGRPAYKQVGWSSQPFANQSLSFENQNFPTNLNEDMDSVTGYNHQDFSADCYLEDQNLIEESPGADKEDEITIVEPFMQTNDTTIVSKEYIEEDIAKEVKVMSTPIETNIIEEPSSTETSNASVTYPSNASGADPSNTSVADPTNTCAVDFTNTSVTDPSNPSVEQYSSERESVASSKTSKPDEKEYQIDLQDVQKLSILTKPELVSICKRNNISVTGEKQALAARILRKLGKIFDDNE